MGENWTGAISDGVVRLVPQADRDELRDAITRAIHDADCNPDAPGGCDVSPAVLSCFTHMADAVLALLAERGLVR